MRHRTKRGLFAAAFAPAVVAVGWLFVDASSPLALGAEVVESGWRIANFVPLLLSARVTNRAHDIPALVAIPIMLCWWFAVGVVSSHCIWGGMKTEPNKIKGPNAGWPRRSAWSFAR